MKLTWGEIKNTFTLQRSSYIHYIFPRLT